MKGERTADVYAALQQAITMQGPVAVCILREMVPGIPELEGTPAGHDVISVKKAIECAWTEASTGEIASVAEIRV